MPKAISLNDDGHPLDELLEDARMAADSVWEEEFVADMLGNRKKYGNHWRPTDMQIAKLRQIAGEDSLGDGFDRC